jgi:DNA-binding XRE family transcriptional regulator
MGSLERGCLGKVFSMAAKKDLNVAGSTIFMTPGEMVKTLRELKGWLQLEPSEQAGISQANISAIENGRVEIGKHRAITFAEAFRVHPASIMFADFDVAA